MLKEPETRKESKPQMDDLPFLIASTLVYIIENPVFSAKLDSFEMSECGQFYTNCRQRNFSIF